MVLHWLELPQIGKGLHSISNQLYVDRKTPCTAPQENTLMHTPHLLLGITTDDLPATGWPDGL